jgi:hydrogenase maturation factor
MNVGRWALFGLGVALILTPDLVFAHHGTAMFEMDHVTTIKGTVLDYQLINPHVQMTLKVGQEAGNAVEWTVEAVSMNMMMRAGFRRDSVKTGDIVSVTGHPGKNGKTIILLTKIALPDGRELSAPYE